jgi:hypothetical protein
MDGLPKRLGDRNGAETNDVQSPAFQVSPPMPLPKFWNCVLKATGGGPQSATFHV